MKQKRRLVIGLGATGLSIARFLQRRHLSFALFDTRAQPAGLGNIQIEFPEVAIWFQTIPADVLFDFEEIICSPGVALDIPVLIEARKKNIPIIGDVECMLRETNTPIIAITGTNGKSTVTTLVGEMAKEAGLKVAIAGNIGLPVLDIFDVGVHYDLWVLELSSFQLDLIHSLKACAATVLNITPDHLDRHVTLENYIKTKKSIYHQATVCIYNRDDPNTTPPKHAEKTMSFGLNIPKKTEWGIQTQSNKTFLAFEDNCLLDVDALKIKGKHNWVNALAAMSLAYSQHISFDIMVNVLKRFHGLPHRCQWVRQLNGIDFINDSKGTNVGATASAISGIGDAIDGRIVLIAGGEGKGADFSELLSPIKAYVRCVILIGVDAQSIATAVKSAVPVIFSNTLESAINEAYKKAIEQDVVLLSPACASFDMFRDFNHRGEVFSQIVSEL